MCCKWNPVFGGDYCGEAVALHEGHYFADVFKLIDRWDKHAVKLAIAVTSIKFDSADFPVD